LKILFDTNIVLDVLLAREPHFEMSAKLMEAVESNVVEGYLCATTLTTINYLVSKFRDKTIAQQAISQLLSLFSITEVNKQVLQRAIDSDFTDFEDAVLYFSGVELGIEGLVTRNVKDFTQADTPIYQPNELFELL